jgi:hypothetical protein
MCKVPSKSQRVSSSCTKKILRYVKGTLNLGLWYGRQTKFNLIGFTDADFAGDRLDRKSTSGTCQFIGGSLLSWSSRKQTSVALSTIEAEYIAAGSCCTQILLMIQTLQDYNLHFHKVSIMCDNTSAIMISNNLVLHVRTKHTLRGNADSSKATPHPPFPHFPFFLQIIMSFSPLWQQSIIMSLLSMITCSFMLYIFLEIKEASIISEISIQLQYL